VPTHTDNIVSSAAPPTRPDSAGTELDNGGSFTSGMQNNATPPADESQIFDSTMQSYDVEPCPELNENNLVDEAHDGSHALQAPGTALGTFADWIDSSSQLMQGMQSFEMPKHLPVQTGRYCGLTGDMDPYLLRLYRFDQQSIFPFKKLAVRSIDAGQLPIQFLQDIGDDSQTPERDQLSRAELDAIVPRSIGERLISL
jgi:hypothetical protein